MRQLIDLTGKVFGRWTVLRRGADGPQKQPHWLCRCSCGTEAEVAGMSLRTGDSRSCGCLRAEELAARNLKHGHSRREDKAPEYYVWAAMIRRCTDPKNPTYPDYGGRGIRVCERWRHDFAAFLADMGPRPPTPAGRRRYFTIERTNNNGHYEPGNCVWAPYEVQARNRRSNTRLTLDGVTHTAIEWSEVTGIGLNTILTRKRLGWSDEKALREPVRRGRSG